MRYVIPYVGGKYSDIRLKDDVTSGGTRYFLNDVENDKKAGPFFGLILVPNNVVSINLQARLVDERAASVDISFKF